MRSTAPSSGTDLHSTFDQDLSLQWDVLDVADCERIFADTISGAKANRPQLAAALDHLRSGGTLVVWRLDRLGRSLSELIDLMTQLSKEEIAFRSLTEQIDTSTSGGKLIFDIFGTLAEFERELIREPTQAGLAAARARGRKGGRPKLLDERKAAMAQALYDSREHSIKDICQTLGVSRATLYRHIKAG